ncbi:hypothetical protein AXX17_AT5G47120 [Arabidopsis thaliana]|uniref:Uncharacterized protein n=1 Tax=Arabidopsis thaliana TaxID=3702 RepID=A0A178UQG1_ARATH|nr:hypothetical protein AXX17_AT5G47120 [Arabidopsis thaliana]
MPSSDISIDFLSDHRRSRTPDGSSECSGADRFRAESLDDDLVEAGYSSSGSSSQTSIVAELRRRISSPLVDRAETSVAATTTFKPRLTDEEIGDEDFKEAIASEEITIFEPRSAVGGGFGDDVKETTVSDEIGVFPAVSGPKPGSADYLGPTKTSASSMNTALRFCNAPRGLVARVPETHERPWTTPEGYMCVYEKFLTECGLSFPIPIFLLGFVARRKMALSQLTVAAIRYAVGLIRLAHTFGRRAKRRNAYPYTSRRKLEKLQMKMNTEEVGSYSSRYKRQKTSAPKESQEKDHLPSGEDRTAHSAEEERRTARSEPPRGHQGVVS